MGLSYTSMLAKMASLSSSLEGNVYINRSKTWRNTNADMSDLIVVKKTLKSWGMLCYGTGGDIPEAYAGPVGALIFEIITWSPPRIIPGRAAIGGYMNVKSCAIVGAPLGLGIFS